MGCMGPNKVNSGVLKDKIKRVRLNADLQAKKCQDEKEITIKQVIKETNKQTGRNTDVEKDMIRRGTECDNKSHIYCIVSREAANLEALFDELEETQMPSSAIKSLNTLLCCSKFLYMEDLKDLSAISMKNYEKLKLPKEEILDIQLIRHYYNNRQITKKMECDFVFMICHEKGIPLTAFNEAGHDYHY